jgi:hypothetical protein
MVTATDPHPILLRAECPIGTSITSENSAGLQITPKASQKDEIPMFFKLLG